MDTTLNTIDKIYIDTNENINILDIGCGVGASTMLLVNYFQNVEVEAIDLFKHYLDVFDEKISEKDLKSRYSQWNRYYNKLEKKYK